MIVVDKAVLTDDIKEKHFVCDIIKCKGACCVEGDYGAPLDEDELPKLAEVYRAVAPYLTPEGREVIEKVGLFEVDPEGDLCTPTINMRECAYAVYDAKGILKCGIEMAWLDDKTQWRKPISCHLYPLRITKYEQYDAINYHEWEICVPACQNGKELGVPLYKFLKEPLITKYGEAWYAQLVKQIEGPIQ